MFFYSFLFVVSQFLLLPLLVSFHNHMRFPYSCSMPFDFIVYHLLHLVPTQRVSALCEFLCMWRSFLLFPHIIHYARAWRYLRLHWIISHRIAHHFNSSHLVASHHIKSHSVHKSKNTALLNFSLYVAVQRW